MTIVQASPSAVDGTRVGESDHVHILAGNLSDHERLIEISAGVRAWKDQNVAHFPAGGSAVQRELLGPSLCLLGQHRVRSLDLTMRGEASVRNEATAEFIGIPFDVDRPGVGDDDLALHAGLNRISRCPHLHVASRIHDQRIDHQTRVAIRREGQRAIHANPFVDGAIDRGNVDRATRGNDNL